MWTTSPRYTRLFGGGGLAAVLAYPAVLRAAAPLVEIQMRGRDGEAALWSDPVGLHVEPGTAIRWADRVAGNSHTATACHPANLGRRRG